MMKEYVWTVGISLTDQGGAYPLLYKGSVTVQ